MGFYGVTMSISLREHELAFRTQYAELKERALAAGDLLPGTPGSLAKRKGTGYSYWYRVYYSAPGKVQEQLVCKDGDSAALNAMRERIAFQDWMAQQVSHLRKLGFQVADKPTARVLVELHNQGAFAAGLVLVGTLAYMAWLNELGIAAVSARTQDIDLARRQKLKLATPLSFLQTMQATGLPFVAVPGLPSNAPATSVKLPGALGLRVDVLAPGSSVGAAVNVPELAWSAQTIPHFDYLLEQAEPAAILAGGQCIPLRLPQAARFVWHKLYASTQRKGFAEKATKDQQQALIIAARLAETESHALQQALKEAPAAMKKPIKALARKLTATATKANQPELTEILKKCL